MSITRRTVIATIAALALAGTMVTSTAVPADAHTYTKVGTISAKEARKLFQETFKQRCLTTHEARHIAHGSGEWEEGYDESSYLTFQGTRKSHIGQLTLSFVGSCVEEIYAYKN